MALAKLVGTGIILYDIVLDGQYVLLSEFADQWIFIGCVLFFFVPFCLITIKSCVRCIKGEGSGKDRYNFFLLFFTTLFSHDFILSEDLGVEGLADATNKLIFTLSEDIFQLFL